uniref:Uncharacterized protein n=1 Tax=Cacopsylla melanoneura TaxID=428564 RepID=A0A8D9EZI5_9HEMI
MMICFVIILNTLSSSSLASISFSSLTLLCHLVIFSFFHEVFFSSFFLLFFSCLSSSLPSSFLDYVINFLFIPFSPSLLFCKNVQYNIIYYDVVHTSTNIVGTNNHLPVYVHSKSV